MAKLYFRYGAMGSSKSANILMVRYNYEERGQYAVLLKPRTDNRDGEDEIKSRIGLSAPAEYVDDFLQEISKCWNVETSEYIYHEKRVAAVLVDEAQFLSPEGSSLFHRHPEWQAVYPDKEETGVHAVHEYPAGRLLLPSSDLLYLSHR